MRIMPEKSKESCPFCDIIAGRKEAHRIDENEMTICILDINPLSKGHCLVIPKRHVPWWHELTEEENASLFQLAGTVARRMMKTLGPDFVCMFARGRRIPHTHVFLVPTFSGDVLDRFFNALELFQESPKELAVLGEERSMKDAAKLLAGSR
jgi:histidine triad (HIT) family protein